MAKIKDAVDKKLITTFNTMKQRCYNPNHSNYKNYGGRGIKICDEWLKDKQKFYRWAYKNEFDPNLGSFGCTIDRINVNGNYEPSNCRWISMMEQQQNRRNNKKVTIKGETKTKAEWAREFNITREGFNYRLKHGLVKI